MTTASSPKKQKTVDEVLCINTVRMLSADQPSAGKSGHPGAPMGCAPMAHVLFGKVMKFNPEDPTWSNRDRFVLSNGHACALQYSMLHLCGYDVSMEDLKNFRHLGSKCPGHPENFATPGVEVCTGPLGQGISNAVGMAIAEKHLAAKFNKVKFPIVDHFTYVICGDGCLQEGVSSEVSSLAGHLGLGKLIVLYDDNSITIDGNTDLSFTEDVGKRYESYGWHVQTVEDGDYGHEAILEAILAAKKVTDKPSMIKVKTIIGLGSEVQNTYKAHGAPLKAEDMENTKSFFGLDPKKSFQVDPTVAGFYNKQASGNSLQVQWDDLYRAYAHTFPELAAEFERRNRGELPENWKKSLPVYKPNDKAMATRQCSEACLNALAEVVPELVGGSADLTPSNLTKLTMSGDFQADTPIGRYLRFGVREHGMAAICNGIFAHGGIRPFCATFYNFIGYAMGAVRLSALAQFGVIYIATHDSIFLGEDGPTHQPIEMNASIRSMPQIYLFRPADGNEVSGSYSWAVEHRKSPSVLALSRQGLPQLVGSKCESVYKGGYVLENLKNKSTSKKPELILIASGSEVSLCVDVAKSLENVHVRVVSLPCRKLFDAQSLTYKKSVLGSGIPVLSVEAGSTFGWREISHAHFGIDSFGASGNIKDLKEHFGFNVETVAGEAESLLEFYSKNAAPCLLNVPQRRHVASKH